MADAGLIAGIVGAVVGTLGAAASGFALVYAHMANDKAKKSIAIAGDSRDLAVEANDLSRQSNTIATGARELAQDANDISRRSESRETERHDVRWEQAWLSKPNGHYMLIKRGNDVAHRVKAMASFENDERVIEAEAIAEDGTQLRFKFGSESYNRDKAAIDEAIRTGAYTVPVRLHSVQVRIEWETDLGTQKVFTENFPVQLVKLPGR